ncbi:hypothetical protein ABZW49_16910 [Nonomuraea wenchangensis]
MEGERSGNAPAALDALAEGLMFDMDDTSWMTDPELPGRAAHRQGNRRGVAD